MPGCLFHLRSFQRSFPSNPSTHTHFVPQIICPPNVLFQVNDICGRTIHPLQKIVETSHGPWTYGTSTLQGKTYVVQDEHRVRMNTVTNVGCEGRLKEMNAGKTVGGIDNQAPTNHIGATPAQITFQVWS